LKRVPPKSFVLSQNSKAEALQYPRGARTPPSTFLFLHLHLSNSPGPERPHSSGRGVPTPFTRRQTVHRLRSVFQSLIKVRIIKGANACLGLVGQCSAALSGRGYSPHRSGLSTGIVNKSSHDSAAVAVRKNSVVFRRLACGSAIAPATVWLKDRKKISDREDEKSGRRVPKTAGRGLFPIVSRPAKRRNFFRFLRRTRATIPRRSGKRQT
jgi:hypothetical protein